MLRHKQTMSKPAKQNDLTDDEMNEMFALKNVINQAPHSVHPDKMEAFTEYLVRSLRQRGG